MHLEPSGLRLHACCPTPHPPTFYRGLLYLDFIASVRNMEPLPLAKPCARHRGVVDDYKSLSSLNLHSARAAVHLANINPGKVTITVIK